jgi:hypothetical protein
MSLDKMPNQLFRTVASMPPELSLKEVEFLFLNPSPPPATKPWWWGGHLKFLLMLALFISLLGLLLPTQIDGTEYQLSAFPVQETTPTSPLVSSLPTTSGLLALETSQIAYTTPRVQRLASKPAIEPAAAPEEIDAVENVISPAVIILPNISTIQHRQTARIPRELYTGKYLYYRNNFSLTFQEVKGGPLNLLFIEFSSTEQRLMKDNNTYPMVIERATGSLLLYGDNKKGTFKFLANMTYRESLNNHGWGDAAAPDNSLAMLTVGKPTKKEQKTGARKPLQPHDQLWFRYFTTNINHAYTDLLQNFGYTDEELNQLWQLANFQSEYEQVKEVLELSAAVFTDRPPLAQFWHLVHQRDALKTLRREGQRMTFEKYRNLRDYQKMFINLPGKDTGPTDRDSLRQLVEQEKELNFSLARPGSSSDTVAYTPGAKIILTGNFKYRINKDLAGQQVIVYGPERAVAKMNRRSDYANLRLTHKNKRQPLYIDVPLHINMEIKSSKGVTTSIKTNPK